MSEFNAKHHHTHIYFQYAALIIFSIHTALSVCLRFDCYVWDKIFEFCVCVFACVYFPHIFLTTQGQEEVGMNLYPHVHTHPQKHTDPQKHTGPSPCSNPPFVALPFSALSMISSSLINRLTDTSILHKPADSGNSDWKHALITVRSTFFPVKQVLT